MAHPFPIPVDVRFDVRLIGAVVGVCDSRAKVLASPRNQAAARLPLQPLHQLLTFGKLAATSHPADFHPSVKFGWNWPIVCYYRGSDKQTDRQHGLIRLVSFGNQSKNNPSMNRAELRGMLGGRTGGEWNKCACPIVISHVWRSATALQNISSHFLPWSRAYRCIPLSRADSS